MCEAIIYIKGGVRIPVESVRVLKVMKKMEKKKSQLSNFCTPTWLDMLREFIEKE